VSAHEALEVMRLIDAGLQSWATGRVVPLRQGGMAARTTR